MLPVVSWRKEKDPSRRNKGKNPEPGDGEMTQGVKALAIQAW